MCNRRAVVACAAAAAVLVGGFAPQALARQGTARDTMKVQPRLVPDLDIVDVQVEPPSPIVGQTVKITFHVKNVGAAPIGPARFTIYGPYTPPEGQMLQDLRQMMTSFAVNDAPVAAGAFQVPALAAGKEARLSVSGVLDPQKHAVPAGTYEAMMDLNVSNKPPEGNTTNNFKGVQFVVRPKLTIAPATLPQAEAPIVPPRPVRKQRIARP